MTDLQGLVTLTATAEVRDKDGNLISSTPVELTGVMSESEAAQIKAQIEGNQS